MSKTLGLTPAMRTMLEWYARPTAKRFEQPLWGASDSRTLNMLVDLGLFNRYHWTLTPRGHAALAAPKMTQAEYELLEWAEFGLLNRVLFGARARVRHGLIDKLWIRCGGGLPDELTPSGLKALNNVRAAIASADYKESK